MSTFIQCVPARFLAEGDLSHGVVTARKNPGIESSKAVPSKSEARSLMDKMAVVNLEAGLAVWKSFQNNQVLYASESYRSSLSRNLRCSPSRTGTLPRHLFNHLMSPDW